MPGERNYREIVCTEKNMLCMQYNREKTPVFPRRGGADRDGAFHAGGRGRVFGVSFVAARGGRTGALDAYYVGLLLRADFGVFGACLAATRLSASAGTPERVRRALRGCFAAALVSGGISAAGLFFGAGFISERVLGDMRCTLPLRLAGLGMPSRRCRGCFTGIFRRSDARLSALGCRFSSSCPESGRLCFCSGLPGGISGARALLSSRGSVISGAASFLAALVVYLP